MEATKRIVKRLKEPISNEKGMISFYGISLLAIVLILFLLVETAFGFRLYSTYSVINEVHEAMNKIVTTSVTLNSEESYSSKRESYTGAYQAKTYSDVLETLTEENIKEKLTEMLNLNTPSGKKLGKYENTADGYKTVYYISDIDISVNNPAMTKDEYIEAEISLTLNMPFSVGGIISKGELLKFKLTANATDAPKY